MSFFIIFSYIPYYYLTIAFRDYDLFGGLAHSPWVGLKYFKMFFDDVYMVRVIRNTLLINIYSLLFGFPVPIIFAILLNELRNMRFKMLVQTVSYLPHFISSAVIVGMVINFLSPSTGIVNSLLVHVFEIEPIHFLAQAEYFRTIFVSMGIWKEFGWAAIIYLAVILSIDPSLYEAAVIDGANKWKQIIHVTLPGMKNIIVITLLLSLGSILTVGYETIILLYNPLTYETGDVISTYVYRRGMGVLGVGAGSGLPDYSYATAVGIFQSVIGLLLIIGANKLSRKYTEFSIW
jgi:putative aldouronate transport system permease protein